jgi:hypothetical protein
MAIEAKRRNEKVGDQAVQQVATGAKHYKCDYAMVMTNSTFQPSTEELAESNDVLLWDRAQLTTKLEKAKMIWTPEPLPAPECPRCGVKFVRRESQRGPFWGCPNLPINDCHCQADIRKSLILLGNPASDDSEPHEVHWLLPGPNAAFGQVEDEAKQEPGIAYDNEMIQPAGGLASVAVTDLGRATSIIAIGVGWIFIIATVMAMFAPATPENVRRVPFFVAFLFVLGVPTVWGMLRIWGGRHSR